MSNSSTNVPVGPSRRRSLEQVELTSVIESINLMDEAHTNITNLLEQLDVGDNTNSETINVIGGMDGLLGTISIRSFEMQQEMNRLLESSKSGALSHNMLADYFSKEQVRSNYLLNILGSLRDQIEGFHNFFHTIIPNDDDDQSMSVSEKINLMLMSVESLGRIASTPSHQLEQTIQSIDVQVIQQLEMKKINANNDNDELLLLHRTTSSTSSTSNKSSKSTKRDAVGASNKKQQVGGGAVLAKFGKVDGSQQQQQYGLSSTSQDDRSINSDSNNKNSRVNNNTTNTIDEKRRNEMIEMEVRRRVDLALSEYHASNNSSNPSNSKQQTSNNHLMQQQQQQQQSIGLLKQMDSSSSLLKVKRSDSIDTGSISDHSITPKNRRLQPASTGNKSNATQVLTSSPTNKSSNRDTNVGAGSDSQSKAALIALKAANIANGTNYTLSEIDAKLSVITQWEANEEQRKIESEVEIRRRIDQAVVSAVTRNNIERKPSNAMMDMHSYGSSSAVGGGVKMMIPKNNSTELAIRSSSLMNDSIDSKYTNDVVNASNAVDLIRHGGGYEASSSLQQPSGMMIVGNMMSLDGTDALISTVMTQDDDGLGLYLPNNNSASLFLQSNAEGSMLINNNTNNPTSNHHLFKGGGGGDSLQKGQLKRKAGESESAYIGKMNRLKNGDVSNQVVVIQSDGKKKMVITSKPILPSNSMNALKTKGGMMTTTNGTGQEDVDDSSEELELPTDIHPDELNLFYQQLSLDYNANAPLDANNNTTTGGDRRLGLSTPNRFDVFRKIFKNVKHPSRYSMIRIRPPTDCIMMDKGTSTNFYVERSASTDVASLNDLSIDDYSDEPNALHNLSTTTIRQGIISSDINAKILTTEQYELVKSTLESKQVSKELFNFVMNRCNPQLYQFKLKNKKEHDDIIELFISSFDKDISEVLVSIIPKASINQSVVAVSDFSSSLLKDLPVYSSNNEGNFVTRSYHQTVDGSGNASSSSIINALYKTDNPIYVIYQHYHPYLSDVEQARLLNACVINNRITQFIPTSNTIHAFISTLLEKIVYITGRCNKMLQILDSSEEMMQVFIKRIKSDSTALLTIVNSVECVKLSSNFGELDAMKISINLQLYEYRTMFERINAQGINELDNLMKASTQFDYCFKYFLTTQGKLIEINNRLQRCKDRCKRHNLFNRLFLFGNSLTAVADAATASPVHTSTELMNINTSKANNNDQQQQQQQQQRAIKSLTIEVNDLRSQLQELLHDYNEQEVEMMEVLKNNDKSPDALLFFSMMHDPSYLQNLHQIILQIKHIKPFVEGSGHLDFITLRKRLQVCVVMVPNIEKLVDKYNSMYAKWSKYRLNWFAERKLNGGSADAFNSCPLCFQVISNLLVTESHHPLPARSSNRVTTTTNKHDSRAATAAADRRGRRIDNGRGDIPFDTQQSVSVKRNAKLPML